MRTVKRTDKDRHGQLEDRRGQNLSVCAGVFLTLLHQLYFPVWSLFPQSIAPGAMAAANRAIFLHHSSQLIDRSAVRLCPLLLVSEGTLCVLRLETCRETEDTLRGRKLPHQVSTVTAAFFTPPNNF